MTSWLHHFAVRQLKTYALVFDSLRAAVLNVQARFVIGFVKHYIIQLSLIHHFSTPPALVKVFFLRFA